MAALDPQSSFRALLPEPFGKYALLGHLATGGVAEVWLARQRGLDGFERTVVIKRARRDLADDDTTTRGVLDEARVLATLEHPNIAQIYEIGLADGAYFFVVEYIDGADLRRVIETAIAKHHPISLGDTLHIVTHVCAALHHAHDKRDLEGRPLHIVHRDVSPSNVLISHDGAIKVCDFGLARTPDRPSEGSPNGARKVAYSSPEQRRREPIDRRSDVFSIGVLLYELTTASKLEPQLPAPSTRVAGYPRELEAIVMKALASHPDERYPTALALQRALEMFARAHALTTSAVGVGALMAALFDRRDGWSPGPRAPQLAPHVTEPHLATGTPVGAPRAVAPAASSSTGLVSTRSARVAKIAAPPSPIAAPRRWVALWLAGAAVAAVIAVGVTVAAQVVAHAADKAAAAALLADAERISSAFDATARAAHLRADGIAATPMLRSSIEAEKPSLHDLASAEMIFAAHKGESLDVFELRGGQATSLVHVPSAAPALPVLKGRETQIQLTGRDATLIASAPIAGYQDNLVGGLVFAMPVDLGPVRRSLAEHAERAIVRGLAGPSGGELVLTGSDRDDAALVSLAVPSGGEWSSEGVTLRAIPRRVEGLAWATPVRDVAGGLSVALLLAFAIAFVRRPRGISPSST